jgi:hypothetical protein
VALPTNPQQTWSQPMRQLIRLATFGALLIAPASAMAFVWPFAHPRLPESYAEDIAYQNGVATITDVDGTIDGDWRVEGTDSWGREVKIIIDGSTGRVERAELDAD